MDIPKYDGNIHPDEWINDIRKYHYIWKVEYEEFLNIVISLIDPTIKLPTEISDIEELRNALKENISFTVFKNTNKRKLQLLKYIPESRGGDTSKFISNFLKLCYNAEINDIEEQKIYLYKSLPMNHFDSISNEFHQKMKNINSLNELIKEFEDFVVYESNLITNDSIVALRHVATGKYLSSVENLCYKTGSKFQLVFVRGSDPGPNSLWKIQFNKELATYTDTSITLQHTKSNKLLGISWYGSGNSYSYQKSPTFGSTEVNCGGNASEWKFNYSKSEENHESYLKSNDIIYLSIKKSVDRSGRTTHIGSVEFLRCHDVRFTIGNDNFQEIVCHNERLGVNDDWCIELIEQCA
ncbi:hypothetical protein RhiirA4_538518 [Rhizophagus irregularis]|uniref:MIR domain-containing protein n=1 Tax=Rhizophagus irregularis TaxID=588596 RepID=A0A2I1G038_9GLOM|nr:hypothetical protein RhiirA4_538518 [Rhizophagus irregularis]